MAESKLHYEDRYMKSYEAFIASSNKYERQDTWSKTVLLDKIVPHLPNLDQDNELRVLGVGSGSGEIEYPFLTALLKKFPIITNRVVEPAEDQINKYKALVQSKGHELQGVKFDWRQQTLEQYRDTDGIGTKFHFISAIHSLYHVGDVESSLMYMYDLLEPGGKLLVIIMSDESSWFKLWRSVPDSLKQDVRYFGLASLQSPFNQRNIPYTHSHQNCEVDITQCFDKTSEDGELLLEFILAVTQFKKKATASQYQDVIELLASSECSKKDGSRVIINVEWDAVIVTKKLSDN
ncbi:histamine N-methyltransferase-like [Asterias rubens]|uniref:histamine N-methyltransferase-like n=1 Tax=Asterias rubens TaxID=7604 RepID=UPI001455D13D|nr:histamine N-methyltransferase-like [Asterias rubens]